MRFLKLCYISYNSVRFVHFVQFRTFCTKCTLFIFCDILYSFQLFEDRGGRRTPSSAPSGRRKDDQGWSCFEVCAEGAGPSGGGAESGGGTAGAGSAPEGSGEAAGGGAATRGDSVLGVAASGLGAAGFGGGLGFSGLIPPSQWGPEYMSAANVPSFHLTSKSAAALFAVSPTPTNRFHGYTVGEMEQESSSFRRYNPMGLPR